MFAWESLLACGDLTDRNPDRLKSQGGETEKIRLSLTQKEMSKGVAAIQQEKWGREVIKRKFNALNMYTGGPEMQSSW